VGGPEVHCLKAAAIRPTPNCLRRPNPRIKRLDTYLRRVHLRISKHTVVVSTLPFSSARKEYLRQINLINNVCSTCSCYKLEAFFRYLQTGRLRPAGCHDGVQFIQLSRNPVMRSTVARTERRSRPLSVRPCPSHIGQAVLSAEHHRLATTTCGGTKDVASSPPASSLQQSHFAATGMATGADEAG
jgi:hypothetical protein